MKWNCSNGILWNAVREVIICFNLNEYKNISMLLNLINSYNLLYDVNFWNCFPICLEIFFFAYNKSYTTYLKKPINQSFISSNKLLITMHFFRLKIYLFNILSIPLDLRHINIIRYWLFISTLKVLLVS